MKPLSLLAGIFLLTHVVCQAQTAASAAKPQRPIPAVKHVLVISVDGLRPDRALLADMPNLRGLIRNGTYTFWAKTTAVSITLPSHTSMLTGVVPGKHGIEWNRDLPFKEPVYSRVPTVFEMATRAGCTASMIAGKSKFIALAKPGTVTFAAMPEEGNSNNEAVTATALKLIAQGMPDLLFVHFPDVDATGHALGWGSAEQMAAIEKTDRLLGEILNALEKSGLRSSTFILLTADHGGAGLSHGADDARSRHIPWIVFGPGVRKNFDLTQSAALEVRTEDTCATVCHLLGLPQQPYFDGHPVMLAFEEAP